MANFITAGEALGDVLRSLAANTPQAQDFKQQMGAANPTTPTVPDYTPQAIRAMIFNTLQTDPEIRALIKTIATS